MSHAPSPPSGNLVGDVTAELVARTRELAAGPIPDAAAEIATHVCLDGVAVTLAGATEPSGVGRRIAAYVEHEGARPIASVVGSGFRSSPALAAFANGTMAHALDFDNTWYPMNHPTSPTLPAILALAEAEGSSGSEVIAALVAAFEVQGRLRIASTGLHTGRGFHKPGTTGIFGAVTGAAVILGLDEDAWLHAFGIAGSRAGSLALNTGTMTKSSHSGHAARMGVECAQLAQAGFTASREVFGRGGFLDTFLGDDHDPSALVDEFAAPLRMIEAGVGFKKYPANYFTHRVIDAVLAVRDTATIDPHDVASLHVRFPAFHYVDRPAPASGLDGKFSVQYTAALALLDGEIDVDSFTDERCNAPDVDAMLERISVDFDPSIPNDFLAMHVEIVLEMADGRRLHHRVDELSGMPGVPLTAAQRVEKFSRCAGRVLDADEVDELAALLERLPELPDVHRIMDLARRPAFATT